VELESGPRISLKIPKLQNAATFALRMRHGWWRGSLEAGLKRKIEGVLWEDPFGFRRGKGTGDAIGMLRIIPERTLDRDGELCACFIDWQNACDRINAYPNEQWH
jgi:hypothetical protein